MNVQENKGSGDCRNGNNDETSGTSVSETKYRFLNKAVSWSFNNPKMFAFRQGGIKDLTKTLAQQNWISTPE